jgi:L-amino acid N-acyltransferase
MRLIECTLAKHRQAILEILNEAILNSTALYDYVARDPSSMDAWFLAKQASGYPVIGIEDATGKLLSFASYATFRAWPAYKYSVEHCVYVHAEHRRTGVGSALLQQLVQRAITQQYHVLVGGIDADNHASIQLHEKLGFQHAGTIQHAGFKFGRWLNLAFYQRILTTPVTPVDG